MAGAQWFMVETGFPVHKESIVKSGVSGGKIGFIMKQTGFL